MHGTRCSKKRIGGSHDTHGKDHATKSTTGICRVPTGPAFSMRPCTKTKKEARIQIRSITGDWTVTRTKDGIHYVHANILREGPNISKQPPVVSPAFFRGLRYGLLFAAAFWGAIACIWFWHVSVAFRTFIYWIGSLLG